MDSRYPWYAKAMTKVLIAVDETEASRHAAEVAAALFPGAEFLALCVAVAQIGWMPPGAAWGYVMPYTELPPRGTDLSALDDEAAARAAERAAEVAADIDSVETIGEVGDPTTSILRTADEHHVDVIVVGSHHKNWLARLVEGSVADTLTHHANVPVLVVAAPPRQR
jgi:nucleotide-binding universal stress UspA family protein